MINVFRSKDVMKNINTAFTERATYPLISVRGVYVAGEYRPVFYADHMVYVKDVSSTKADTHTYTTQYRSMEYDDWVKFLGFDYDQNTIGVVDFTSRSQPLEPDDWVKFLGFDYDKNDLKIVDFLIVNSTPEADDWVKFLGFDYDKNDFIVTDITDLDTRQMDFMVRVTEIGGTKATISH